MSDMRKPNYVPSFRSILPDVLWVAVLFGGGILLVGFVLEIALRGLDFK